MPNFCYNLSFTLHNNIEKSNTNEKAADTLHRRCSSEQAYYEIIGNNRFELSPNKERSNFLELPSDQAYGHDQNAGDPNIGHGQSEQITCNRIERSGPSIGQTLSPNIELNLDVPIDHNLTQSIGQCLGQTLGQSLEKNLEQSMQHTQQQPDLFRSKEEEKLKELEKDLIVDACLATPTRCTQAARYFNLNERCKEINGPPSSNCYSNGNHCASQANLQSSSPQQQHSPHSAGSNNHESGYQNSIRKPNSSMCAGSQANHQINHSANQQSKSLFVDTHSGRLYHTNQTNQFDKINGGNFSSANCPNAGNQLMVNNQVSAYGNGSSNMIQTMNQSMNQSMNQNCNQANYQNKAYNVSYSSTYTPNASKSTYLVQPSYQTGTNYRINNTIDAQNATNAYSSGRSPRNSLIPDNQLQSTFANLTMMSTSPVNPVHPIHKSPENQISKSPVNYTAARSPVNPTIRSPSQANLSVPQTGSMQATGTPQSNDSSTNQMNQILYASNYLTTCRDAQSTNDRQQLNVINPKQLFYSQPTTPSSPMQVFSNPHTSGGFQATVVAGNQLEVQNAQITHRIQLTQSIQTNQLIQTASASQTSQLNQSAHQAAQSTYFNNQPMPQNQSNNLVRSLCSPVRSNHLLSRHLPSRSSSYLKSSSPSMINSLTNLPNSPIDRQLMGQTNLISSNNQQSSDANHLMTSKGPANYKYIN